MKKFIKKYLIELKSTLTIAVMLFLVVPTTHADEGMWLPYLLGNNTYKEMRKLGMKMSKEEIFSLNESCISRAVVGLVVEGPDATHSFATGSLVSEDGLLLTNFHCVMKYLGRFSLSTGHDFIKYGYWSKSPKEESSCRDLMVKQLLRIEDVTEILREGTEGLSGKDFSTKLNANGSKLAKRIEKEYHDKGQRGVKIKLNSLYANNQYIMSVYRVFKDVRLVAAAPQMIGMYGGTQDNWLWPRYTGDFALLRIYVNKENQPARYNKSNKMLQTDSYLKISKKGVKKDDFVMIVGYPGKTQRNTPSFGLNGLKKTLEASIDIRAERIQIMQDAMKQDEKLHARYLPTLSSVSNSYLKWKGVLHGFYETNLVAEKEADEQTFLDWCAEDSTRSEYAQSYLQMKKDYPTILRYRLAKTYFNECVLSGSEIIPYIGKFEKLVAMHTSKRKLNPKREEAEARRLVGLTKQFFKVWSYDIDRKTVRAAITSYYKNMPTEFWDQNTAAYIKEYNGDIDHLIEDAFKHSLLTHPDSIIAYLEPGKIRDIKKITDDKLYQIAIGFYKVYITKINRQLQVAQSKQTDPYRIYMQGLMTMQNKDRINWPDANNSQRLSYGKVSDAQPEEAVTYRYYTDMKGLKKRAAIHTGDNDYALSKRFNSLIEDGLSNPSKKWDGYAYPDGSMRICFMTNAHTTSGSSGSPVLNAHGELVGLNFDSMWQGTVSDYVYTGTNRSISTDISYIRWVINVYAKRNYIK